jgi:hypothetical protein
VRELFDVAVLPGVRNAGAIGFKTREIERAISIDDGAGGGGPSRGAQVAGG